MGRVSIRETLLVLVALVAVGLVTTIVLAADGGPPTVWRANLNSPVTSGPALVGDRVFAGSESGFVFALDAATGDVIWQRNLAATPRGAILSDGARLYLRSDEGHVIALEMADGSERWRMQPEGGVNPPILAGDSVLFATRPGVVTAVDAVTGVERWSTDTDRTMRAAPAVVGDHGDRIAVGDIGGRLITLARETGTLLDEVEVGDEFAGPVLQADELLIAGPRASVVALETDGLERWRIETGQPTRLPMIARNGVLYADASPDILAIDLATGRLLWRYTSRALAVTFGVGDGLVIAGMHQGEVHGIDLATGERLWRYRTNDSVRGAPVIDETEGVAYFGTLDGFIHAISLRGEEVEGSRGWWPW